MKYAKVCIQNYLADNIINTCHDLDSEARGFEKKRVKKETAPRRKLLEEDQF